jgi:hypothetical protein
MEIFNGRFLMGGACRGVGIATGGGGAGRIGMRLFARPAGFLPTYLATYLPT